MSKAKVTLVSGCWWKGWKLEHIHSNMCSRWLWKFGYNWSAMEGRILLC